MIRGDPIDPYPAHGKENEVSGCGERREKTRAAPRVLSVLSVLSVLLGTGERKEEERWV